jgi:hypothetical protein
MKMIGMLLVVSAVFAGCGGGNADEPTPAVVNYSWEKGPAPGTGSNAWVLSPGASKDELDSICGDFHEDWPEEASGEDQVTIADDTNSKTSSLVCVRVE